MPSFPHVQIQVMFVCFIGKDENIEEYASETKFRYQFKRNVTTMVGQHGMNGREDGSYAASKLQRTWFC